MHIDLLRQDGFREMESVSDMFMYSLQLSAAIEER